MEIRIATVADARGIQAIYAPVVRDTAISFEVEPPTIEEMMQRVEGTMPSHPWLVATDGETLLGYAYGQRFAARAAYAWSVDASVYVHGSARGRGVGRTLYARLFRILQAQGYRQVFAGITLPNPASVALHESVGFEPIAVYHDVGWKLGAWRAVGRWQLHLSDDHGPPAPVRSLDELDPEELNRLLR